MEGSSSHPRGMMASKACIIASWDIMVFGNGQGKGAEHHSGLWLPVTHARCARLRRWETLWDLQTRTDCKKRVKLQNLQRNPNTKSVRVVFMLSLKHNLENQNPTILNIHSSDPLQTAQRPDQEMVKDQPLSLPRAPSVSVHPRGEPGTTLTSDTVF